MRRPPIRIRTFILGTVLALLVVPTLAGGAAWLIERDHQQAEARQQLRSAVDYLTAHHSDMQEPGSVRGFSSLLDRRGLLAQLVLVTTSPPGKHPLYLSAALQPSKAPALRKGLTREQARKAKLAQQPTTPAPAQAGIGASWTDHHRTVPAVASGSKAILVVDLYDRPASRTTRALVALVSGVVVLLAGLAIAVWLAGRWMVAPLAGLSDQVDKVAGGDLTIAVPRSRISEIANIAQAVEGMTDALGETAHRRAEADEARRFLVTSIAHDLRTPLFALRGHLQAIATRLGNPGVHLERAEARADALERLVGNLFAYTRDDYAQPAPQLEAVPLAGLLEEVAAGLEHATRLRDSTFELDGDRTLVVVVDRDRFKRSLTNVLDNALRYSPPGAPVQLAWAAADASTVQITVLDHGPGIDPGLLPHIFEPGIRGAPATDASDGGAGLGLAIAKRLLEHQHATLTVDNHPTGGTVVRLTLQRAPAPDPR
jgi:signal transduction histidine kinase